MTTSVVRCIDDPSHPNCVGGRRLSVLDEPSPCASMHPLDPPWGCVSDTCPPGEGPGTTAGYSLITELDQIYSAELGSTLCVAYPAIDSATQKPFVDAEGFWNVADKSCRTGNWDPKKPAQVGIPSGDWCAATNGPATAACHDAWQTKAFQVWSGARIRVPADPTAPMTTCPF